LFDCCPRPCLYLMRSIQRRAFLEYVGAATLGAAVHEARAKEHAGRKDDVNLEDGWLIQSSTLVGKDGEAISRAGFVTQGWYRTWAPSIVLSGLVKKGVYPAPLIGLNPYRIPDS